MPAAVDKACMVMRVARCRLLPEFIEVGEGAPGRVGALVRQLPPANLSTLQARPHPALSRFRVRHLTYAPTLLALHAPGERRNRKGCAQHAEKGGLTSSPEACACCLSCMQCCCSHHDHAETSNRLRYRPAERFGMCSFRLYASSVNAS